MNQKFKISYIIPPLIGLAGLSSSLVFSKIIKEGIVPQFNFLKFDSLNYALTLQFYIVLVSIIVLLIMYLYNKRNFKEYFRFGDIRAEASPIKWLRIKPKSSWINVGGSIAIILTSGTLIFMVIALVSAEAFTFSLQYLKLLPLVILISLTNSWSEEIFTRFSIVMGLSGKLKPNKIYWISALVFGIPHYFGTPGGPIGVLMAVFLGWLLAKSVYETKGIFWAWFIHFVQDVVIYSSLLMIIIK